MSGVEFRSKSSSLFNQDLNRNQLTLPFVAPVDHEVHWLHGVLERRRKYIGHKVTAQLIIDKDGYFPEMTFLNAADIAELSDPDLRYALRFADAANAVGWTHDGPDSKSAHDVTIVATDAGVDSRLLEASYTGIVKRGTDTFLQNLHAATPELCGEHKY